MIKIFFSVAIFTSIFLLAPHDALAFCSGAGCSPIINEATCNASPGCTWSGDSEPFPFGDSEIVPTGDSEPVPSGGQQSDSTYVGDVPLINPITGVAHGEGADPYDLIAKVANNIIKILLGLVGIFAMIGFIWGGVTWMTSYGDTAKIERGKKMMIWGVVGLIVIFSSYAIANYIFEAIGAVQATQ